MNSVTLVGALTKNPELKGAGGSPVCRLRLVEANANPDRPFYISVSVFGPAAENCHRHLSKGRQVAVAGQLRFREWERVDKSRRSEISIAADRVDFLPRSSAPEPDSEQLALIDG